MVFYEIFLSKKLYKMSRRMDLFWMFHEFETELTEPTNERKWCDKIWMEIKKKNKNENKQKKTVLLIIETKL